jgi:multimeric flavodoxin WrbA
MRAVVLNCSLKKSPEGSNTQLLADVVVEALEQRGVDVRTFRVVDHSVPPGVVTDLGDGDEWPMIHGELLDAEILVVATPTWVGHPSSIAQRVIERMDAMISEQDDEAARWRTTASRASW